MKTRKGFVTNSSSSSFIVAIKEEINIEEELNKIFKLPDKHILSGIGKGIVSKFLECCDLVEHDEYFSKYPEDYEREIELKEEGYKVYIGSFSNEEDYIEGFLCDLPIDFKNENIIIEKDGGY